MMTKKGGRKFVHDRYGEKNKSIKTQKGGSRQKDITGA